MNEKEFVYWLQGFFEIGNPETITEVQLQIIKDHLEEVQDTCDNMQVGHTSTEDVEVCSRRITSDEDETVWC